MPTTITALSCSITKNSITINFSEPVDSISASYVSNYTVYDPPTIPGPTALGSTQWKATLVDSRTVVLSTTNNSDAFAPGDFVLVGISNVTSISGDVLQPTDFSAQVPFGGSKGRRVRDVEDAISYPILTQEVSSRPSPISTIPGGGMIGGGTSSIGQLASRTLTDMIGWKVNPADPRGFVGALTQAFTLNDVEGHTEATWNSQMPAIQTDLGGSITGAQASLYMRAKDAIDRSSSLLDSLYPLDPEADPEYVKALREMVRSQMTQVVRELSVVGLPSVLRIDTYLDILLGQNPAKISTGTITFDPDQVGGTLGKLRDTYGIQFAGNPFNNSVADEAIITNFRVISDYLTSLMQSWISNRLFFYMLPDTPAFFGTQLVLISRQFNVIAETVNELRFTFDSVFIGPAERQALLLRFADATALPPRFLESILIEIEAFVGDEGPRLLKDGGKITVTNNILPVVRALLNMVEEAHAPTNINELPDGFRTARVRNALDNLEDQLGRLAELVGQVEQDLPEVEAKLAISRMKMNASYEGEYTLEMYGEGIEPGVMAEINSTVATILGQESVTFYSAQRVDISFSPSELNLEDGSHDVTLINLNSDTFIVKDAFTVKAGSVVTSVGSIPRVVNVSPASRPGGSSEGASQGAGVKRAGASERARSKPGSSSHVGGRQGVGPVRPQVILAAPLVSTAKPAPNPPITQQVQDLVSAHTKLEKKLDVQSEKFADLNAKMDSLFDLLKGMSSMQGKPEQDKQEQNSKPQRSQSAEQGTQSPRSQAK